MNSQRLYAVCCGVDPLLKMQIFIQENGRDLDKTHNSLPGFPTFTTMLYLLSFACETLIKPVSVTTNSVGSRMTFVGLLDALSL